jgi:peroxiredoxin family protein
MTNPSDIDWIKGRNLTSMTAEEVVKAQNLSDDDISRCSTTMDVFAIVESNRRLRMTIKAEE